MLPGSPSGYQHPHFYIFTERFLQEVESQLKSAARGDTGIVAVLDLVRSDQQPTRDDPPQVCLAA